MPGAPLGTSARDCVENECNWSASVTGYWCFTVVPWSANSISRPIARPRSSDGSWNPATNETHVKDVAGQTVRYVAGLDIGFAKVGTTDAISGSFVTVHDWISMVRRRHAEPEQWNSHFVPKLSVPHKWNGLILKAHFRATSRRLLRLGKLTTLVSRSWHSPRASLDRTGGPLKPGFGLSGGVP